MNDLQNKVIALRYEREPLYSKLESAINSEIASLQYMRDRIGFVMAEEGFNESEIDDIIERLTPPKQ